jgi:hypothetical protein
MAGTVTVGSEGDHPVLGYPRIIEDALLDTPFELVEIHIVRKIGEIVIANRVEGLCRWSGRGDRGFLGAPDQSDGCDDKPP